MGRVGVEFIVRIYSDIEILKGKTLNEITISEFKDEILFYTDDAVYKMFHEQDCCESVEIEEIIGDLDELLHSPIVMAEKVTNEGESEWGTQTWTFYKLATNKGYVTIRWLGESNGYYSEEVDFIKVT